MICHSLSNKKSQLHNYTVTGVVFHRNQPINKDRMHPCPVNCDDEEHLQQTSHMVKDPAWSFVVFQTAAAAMLGGALIAACTAVSIGFTGGVSAGVAGSSSTLAYSSALSVAICGVAYVNYNAMKETRLRTIKREYRAGSSSSETPSVWSSHANKLDDFVITTLRYSDWVVTFPLLALKLFDLASDGPNTLTHGFLTSNFIHALIAGLGVLMIACGFIALISTGDFESARTDCRKCKFVPCLHWAVPCLRTVCYLVGMACLIGLYIILHFTIKETKSVHATEVYVFGGVWFLYPIVFLLQIFNKLEPRLKDNLFALLDVLSKPLLAVYIAQAAFQRAS